MTYLEMHDGQGGPETGRPSQEDYDWKEEGKGESGDMTVREAGQKGGERVRELVEEGEEKEPSPDEI